MARVIQDRLQAGAIEPPTVSINAAKPRKGVFEVRVGDDVIVTTGPEDRPFPALKALDVDAVASSAVKNLALSLSFAFLSKSKVQSLA